MFKERFIKICTEKGVAPTYVCKRIGLSSATFSQWDDNSMPRATTLHKLANYLGVTIEYLKGEEEAESTVENEYYPINEQEITLLKSFRGTTQEGRMRIIQAVLNICDEIEITALNGKNYNSAG